MKRPFRYKLAPPAATIHDLVAAFRRGPRYAAWSPSSRGPRDAILGRFAQANGAQPVTALTRGAVIAMRDQLGATPGAAQTWLKVIRLLLDHAVDLEMIASNPARTVAHIPLRNPDGIAAWSEDHIARFIARHQPGAVAHTCMAVMLHTAAARSDAVALGWQNIEDGWIRYRRQKMRTRGGVEVRIPIMAPLLAVLEALPRDRMTFLETRGHARSAKALGGAMAQWVAQAGLPPGLSCHGLRKAQARRLAEAGCTPAEIMSWLGHQSIVQAAHYAASYDRTQAAARAAERLANISPPQSVVVALKR